MAEKLPERVVVIGGGRMGSGIAHAFVMNGCAVSVVESGSVDLVRDRVRTAVARSLKSGSDHRDPDDLLEQFTVVPGVSQLTSGADLVIEAVPEDAELKSALLRDVEAVAGPTALIATNTSSLSITGLAAALKDPSRFIGMHFFNPVPVSVLVEVVVGRDTSPESVAMATAVTESLGKTSIVVQDSPGFATSRLGLVIGLEAMRMLEEGVASAEDIDKAMVLGYRHPTGPLMLTDLVGLDVRLAVADHLSSTLGPRFEPPAILREKVSAGSLGKKSGEGFYVWDQ